MDLSGRRKNRHAHARQTEKKAISCQFYVFAYQRVLAKECERDTNGANGYNVACQSRKRLLQFTKEKKNKESKTKQDKTKQNRIK